MGNKMTLKAIFGNRRMAGEIFQGALSLTILAFVIFLYFSNYNVRLFDVPNNVVGKNLSLTYYFNSSEIPIGNGQFTPPSQRVIILRLDDVQAYGWDDIAINLTETVLKKNISITLGVIPDGMEKSNPVSDFLLKNSKNPLIEIAQHGTNKHEDTLTNATVEEIYNSTKIGMQKIALSTGVIPITFATPYNVYSLESTEALSQLGFRILSAKEREFRTNGYITLIGYDTQTKIYGQPSLVNISTIIYLCNLSLNSKNTCVIMMHPQDYANSNGRMDPQSYQQFLELLDQLDNLNATFVTFKDLVKCKDYYWFDDTHLVCNESSFCGIHTYNGLREFQSKESCENAIGNSSLETIEENGIVFEPETKNTSTTTISTSTTISTTSVPKTTTTASSTTTSSTTTSTTTTSSTTTSTSTTVSTTTTSTAIPTTINATTTTLTKQCQEIRLEVDDYAFYSRGVRVDMIWATKGCERIYITGMTEDTYIGGIVLRGCGTEAIVMPGQTSLIELDAKMNCAINSYWPSTDIMKSSLAVEVG